MTAELVVAVIAVVLAVLAGLGALASMLALGALAKDLEAFKNGVRGMAGAADEGFASDRLRLSQIEKFLVQVFKLDELFGMKAPEESEKQADLNVPPKKKSDLN